MTSFRAIACVMVLSILGIGAVVPVQAQAWKPYRSVQDFFVVDLPAVPVVSNSKYATEYNLTLPARVYSVNDASVRYSLTVVDWREQAQLQEARFKACDTTGDDPNVCEEDEGHLETRGAMVYALWPFIQRGRLKSEIVRHNTDGVEGIRGQFVNLDGSQTLVVIHWHENRLYIIDVTAPKGRAQPGTIVQNSFGFIDQEGRRIRYAGGPYVALFPVPKRER